MDSSAVKGAKLFGNPLLNNCVIYGDDEISKTPQNSKNTSTQLIILLGVIIMEIKY